MVRLWQKMTINLLKKAFLSGEGHRAKLEAWQAKMEALRAKTGFWTKIRYFR